MVSKMTEEVTAYILEPTLDLRFVERDGKLILQRAYIGYKTDDYDLVNGVEIWEDVPVVEEEE